MMISEVPDLALSVLSIKVILPKIPFFRIARMRIISMKEAAMFAK